MIYSAICKDLLCLKTLGAVVTLILTLHGVDAGEAGKGGSSAAARFYWKLEGARKQDALRSLSAE
jgi:hypothetical protein